MTSQCYAGRSRPRQRSADGAAAKSGRGAGIGSWMVVLGIETTCDETAAAVVERPGEGRGRILSNIVLSQIEEHAAFGGVVPEIAARAHVEALDLIVAKAMAEAGLSFASLDGIAAAVSSQVVSMPSTTIQDPIPVLSPDFAAAPSGLRCFGRLRPA